MAEKSGDCYIDVWREADFGPNAFVMAFRHREFRDKLITFGPNDEVADLSQFKFDDDIESMKVIDSFKIFDRVGYNCAPEPEAPEASPADGGGGRAPENRHKRRRRPGKKG
jgi:hypothetical protein